MGILTNLVNAVFGSPSSTKAAPTSTPSPESFPIPQTQNPVPDIAIAPATQQDDQSGQSPLQQIQPKQPVQSSQSNFPPQLQNQRNAANLVPKFADIVSPIVSITSLQPQTIAESTTTSQSSTTSLEALSTSTTLPASALVLELSPATTILQTSASSPTALIISQDTQSQSQDTNSIPQQPHSAILPLVLSLSLFLLVSLGIAVYLYKRRTLRKSQNRWSTLDLTMPITAFQPDKLIDVYVKQHPIDLAHVQVHPDPPQQAATTTERTTLRSVHSPLVDFYNSNASPSVLFSSPRDSDSYTMSSHSFPTPDHHLGDSKLL